MYSRAKSTDTVTTQCYHEMCMVSQYNDSTQSDTLWENNLQYISKIYITEEVKTLKQRKSVHSIAMLTAKKHQYSKEMIHFWFLLEETHVKHITDHKHTHPKKDPKDENDQIIWFVLVINLPNNYK